MFDFTVHLGDLITICGFLFGGAFFIFRVEGRLNVLIAERRIENQAHDGKFDAIERELGKIADCMIQLAKQEERINSIAEKLEDVINRVRPKKRQSRSKT